MCTLDPLYPESPSLLTRYARYFNISGVRLTDTAGESPGFGHDGHRRLFEVADELGLVICALTNYENADGVATMLADYPGVPIVLDHMMNLRVGAEPTLRALERLASFPNAHAKLTFAVTGSDEPYPCRDTHELIHQVIQMFGPSRCMWGSDFPCEL